MYEHASRGLYNFIYLLLLVFNFSWYRPYMVNGSEQLQMGVNNRLVSNRLVSYNSNSRSNLQDSPIRSLYRVAVQSLSRSHVTYANTLRIRFLSSDWYPTATRSSRLYLWCIFYQRNKILFRKSKIMRTNGSPRDISPLMRQHPSLLLILSAVIMLMPLCDAVKDCWDFQGAKSKGEVVERAKGSPQFALFSNPTITRQQPPSTLVMASRSGPIVTNLTGIVSNTDINTNVSETITTVTFLVTWIGFFVSLFPMTLRLPLIIKADK